MRSTPRSRPVAPTATGSWRSTRSMGVRWRGSTSGSGARPIIYAPRDLTVVLPRRIYGLDVTLHVGERHLLDGVALAQITRDLNKRGVLLDQRHTGRVFRDYVALTMLARGDDAALQQRLRGQGGIVLMFDGVQFEDRSPVLYLAWDAISGEPLFGERKLYKGEDDLVPLLKRVRAMNVPVIGVVTDKEKGLVPAVEQVFPEVPYQFCQTHFLKNCAKPMQGDLAAVQASVRRRADLVRKIGKRLAKAEASTRADTGGPTGGKPPAKPSQAGPEEGTPQSPTAPISESQLAQEVCELARVNSRVSGRAILDPAELKRHDRLEEIRTLVNDSRKKNSRAHQQHRVADPRRPRRGP